MSDAVVVSFPGLAVPRDAAAPRLAFAMEVHRCDGVPVRFEELPELEVAVPRSWKGQGGARGTRRLRKAIVEAGLEVVSMMALDGEAAEVAIRPDRRVGEDGRADAALSLVVQVTRRAS